MGFSQNIVNLVLVKCKRSCCICHKFCGTKIELHHIKQVAEGGEDTEENCIPLCLDCHAEVKAYNPKHPKGRSYSEKELAMHRDNWYDKVAHSGAYFSNKQYQKIDKKTFAEINELFTKDIHYFLAKFNFADDYILNDWLDSLYKFVYMCDDPNKEFLGSDLETLKVNLYTKICGFLHSLSINTFGCGENIFNVPQEWCEEQPERFDRVVKLLNSEASASWDAYSEFVRTARRKLLI